MQAVLTLIPAAALGCFLVYQWNRPDPPDPRRGWLGAWIGFNTYLVLSLEALSLFRAVTPLGLSLAWLLPALVFTGWAWRRRRSGLPVRLPRFPLPQNLPGWLALAVIVLVLGATLLLALIAPPQNWDSLTYHMSRVAHWAQNRSVGHYVTGIERQNSMSPGAEMQVLVGYVLAESDRLANLPAWFGLLGSAVAAAWCAIGLGDQRSAPWLAAGFAATLPVVIMQASSASTDIIAGCWTASAAALALAAARHPRPADLVSMALAAGLSLLTKPTTAPFLLPFFLWVGVVLLRRMGFRNALRWAVVMGALVFLINAGYLGRNWVTYQSFSNPVDFAVHSNQNRTPAGIISTTLKNLALHATLPGQPWWNLQIFRLVLGVHVKTGLDINDPRTTADGEFAQFSPILSNDDWVTNPYHAYLALALAVLALPFYKRVGLETLLYTALVVAGILGFSALFKWNVYGVRYHLVMFVLLAPAAGAILAALAPQPLGVLVIAGLLVGSLPMLFSNSARPFVVRSETQTPKTALTSSRLEMQFASAGGPGAYQAVVDRILARSCNQVGLALLGQDPEYLFWVLLGAPRRDLYVEWIVSQTASEKYESPNFQPCAVICAGCPPDKTTYRSLPRVETGAPYQLFLAP